MLGPGEVFAGYTIVRFLGSGGMGEVYLARHPHLPREDALKILRPDIADEGFRQRFIREADLAAALSHPHIIGVYDRGEFEGQMWIATQYVDGTDAAELMRERFPVGMPAAEASAIVTAIASALDYAHDRGFLHRDVKPANILLSQPDRDGQRQVYLADFGIARPLADPNGLTATNLTVGTVAYAAPEQLMGNDLDGRANEYALAATAFHLLTGTAPYQNSNPVAVISQHLSAPVPALSERRADLAGLDAVFQTALAKDPAQRFDSCGQFAKAFAQQAGTGAVGGQPTQAGITVAAPMVLEQTTVAPSPPADAPRRKRLRRALITGATLVAAAAVAAFTILAYTHRNTHPKPAAVPGPTLDGTYQLVFDNTKQAQNGAPNPPPPSATPPKPVIWAFRSLCTATGCVATGTALDANNPTVAARPAVTARLRFTDGRWQYVTPSRHKVDEPQCLGADQKVGPGSDTVVTSRTFEPQADGTLRGFSLETYVTGACGVIGAVFQAPFVATRTGDVPAGVTVADPADQTAAPPPTTNPPPPPGSPVLDGTYRIDYDDAHQTVNGDPATGTLKSETDWIALRSLCSPTQCVATGAFLKPDNQQAPSGAASVLRYTDGHWQDIANLSNQPCSTTNAAQAVSQIWTLQPQPDGTLTGDSTQTILTNQCDRQGFVYKTPVVATRTGDVPPAAVLADPTLFLKPK